MGRGDGWRPQSGVGLQGLGFSAFFLVGWGGGVRVSLFLGREEISKGGLLLLLEEVFGGVEPPRGHFQLSRRCPGDTREHRESHVRETDSDVQASPPCLQLFGSPCISRQHDEKSHDEQSLGSVHRWATCRNGLRRR